MKQAAGEPQADTGLGPAFSALLQATFITNLGDGMRLAALPLLAASLTSSPLLVSGVVAAQFLPWTTFAPFGGVIVDRADRRGLIVVTQAWRGTVMAGLGLAVLGDVVEVWHLFVVAFVITAGEILVDPSVVATVPTLVPPTQLDRANGQISSVEIVTNNFVGGPVGAAAFGLAPWLPFVVDGSTYLVSILPFRRLPANEPKRKANPAGAIPSVRAELGAGLRWIQRHPFLRPVTLAMAVFHIGTAGAFSLLILLVIDVLEAPEIMFGVVLAAAAAGATLASLVAARLVDRFSRRSVQTVAALITTLSVIGAGLAQTQSQLVVAWIANGAGGGVLLAIGRGFVQRHTPNDLIGRAAIATRMITRTSFVVGALAAGSVATAFSIRWSFVMASGFHLVGSALLWRSFDHELTPA